jgi:tetratricopeptide (TPR) repeat protein
VESSNRQGRRPGFEVSLRAAHDGTRCRAFKLAAAVLAFMFAVHPGLAQAGSGYEQTVLAIQRQIEEDNLDAAKVSLHEAQRRYPHDGGLENLLGVVEIQRGNTEEAGKAFAAAIADSPRLIGPYLNLSRLKMQAATTDKQARAEALRLTMKILQLDPHNDEARYQAATIHTWNREFRLSLDDLRQLTADARTKVGAQALACADHAALARRDDTTSAAAALVANADLSEQDAQTCIPFLREAKRADLIDDLLTAAAAHQPLSPAGLRILGLAQEGEGKLTPARGTLERAFAANPQSVGVLEDLTRVAKSAGDNQGALGYLAHARDLKPQDPSLAYEFGVICVRMGLLAEARKALADALHLDPKNPDYNLSMGIVVSFSEDPSQSIPYLVHYHELRPNDPEGVLALGSAQFRAKDFDAAAKWLQLAASNEKTAPDAFFYLGRIARQEGRLDEATDELKKSLALRPDQADALAELGQIKLASHENEQATAYFAQALHMDPDNYGANFGLLQLYARTGDPRRESQSQRFDQIKSLKEERDKQMMRVIEVRPHDGSTAPD